MAEDNNKPGIGTAATVAAVTAAGTAGVAYGNAKWTISSAGEKGKLVTGAEEATKAFAEASKNLHTGHPTIIADVQKHLGEDFSAIVSPEDTIKQLNKVAEKAEAAVKTEIGELVKKLTPLEQAEKTMSAAAENLGSARALKDAFEHDGATWAKKLSAAVAHSPKKIAFVAAPAIAALGLLAVTSLSGDQKAELNGSGQSKA